VLEVGDYPCALVPVSQISHLTIPIVLLIIPFYVHVLPDPLGWTQPPTRTCSKLTSNLQHLCTGCRLLLGQKDVQFDC
jgi:hypothetical protein